MNTPTLIQQAPESYATFWAPLAAGLLPAPARVEPAGQEWPGKAKDAYLEFTEVTEGVSPATRGERS